MKSTIHAAIIRNLAGGVLFLLLTTFSANAFTNLTAQITLHASNWEQSDLYGYAVGISGDTVVVGALGEDSNATGVNGVQTNNLAPLSGAAYIHVRNITTWSQQAYLKASNTGLSDQFGRAVGISGNTVVIGAPAEDSNATGVNGDGSNNSTADAGAAYVFVRNGTTWSQQAYLKASNPDTNDGFGSVVAISGDTIVVGVPLEASNGNQADNSLYGAGAAYVFVRNGTTWSQQAYLKASNPGESDAFGLSVAISGDTIVVGAYGEDSNATGINGVQTNNLAPQAGAAYVFVRNGTTWSQQAYLKGSNTETNDGFGRSVAISSNTVVVGAWAESSSATNVNGIQTNNLAPGAGAAYVFVRSGTNWSQQAYLKASNAGSNDLFGTAVALAGDNLMVGAILEDSSAFGINEDQTDNSIQNSGAVYVFSRTGTNWSQKYYLKAAEFATTANSQLGDPLAISSDTVVVGYPATPGFFTGAAGETYIFNEPIGPSPNLVAVEPPQIYLFTNATGQFTASVVTGGTPLAYQWFNGIEPIINATSSTLVFTNAQLSDADYYTVSVLFANGVADSTNAGLLYVLSSVDDVSLFIDPTYQTVPIGSPATIASMVFGPTPLSFQWQKNNVIIPGATNATIVFNSAQLTNSADYTFSVTYSSGSVTNLTPSTLIVYFAQPPVITGSRIFPPGTMELTFTGLTNRNYQIDYTDALTPPISWQPFDVTTLTTNPVVYPIDFASLVSAGIPNAYFRVLILPP